MHCVHSFSASLIHKKDSVAFSGGVNDWCERDSSKKAIPGEGNQEG